MLKLKKCLILGSLMILNGCSTSQSAGETKYISIPESLLQEFCVEWKGVGDTVSSLADAYVANTTCGKKYEAQLKEQKQFIQKMNLKEDI